MSKCDIHRGRDAVPNVSYFGKRYCTTCIDQIKKARSAVPSHATPKDCFIWYKNNAEGWVVIVGTGCAHWVAHQKGIKGTFNFCAEGYAFRVPDVIFGARKIDRTREDVRKSDIWVNERKDHCGLVVKVEGEGESQRILIRHCSSGRGGVITSDFTTYFKGKGNFWRR